MLLWGRGAYMCSLHIVKFDLKKIYLLFFSHIAHMVSLSLTQSKCYTYIFISLDSSLTS